MRALTLTLMAAGLALAAIALPAAAYAYPYCLQGRGLGIPGDCSYSTYEQCQASASGRLATCNINPRVAFGTERAYRERPYRSRSQRNRPRNDDYEWN